MEITDAELLQRYAAKRSETAFAELVRRHVRLVYHTALRHLDGDTHGAEDIAQVVFSTLARKARPLSRRLGLVGWLHTTTRYAALQRRRAEHRRRHRELEANAMPETNDEPAADWNRLRPAIDDALQALDEHDREAVLLRFFSGCNFADLGRRLNLTPDGARSRVDRALEKLQRRLVRQGITSSTTALSLALTTQSTAAIPPGLAATLSGAVMSAATAGPNLVLIPGLPTFMKASTALLAASLVANLVLGLAGEPARSNTVRAISAAPPSGTNIGPAAVPALTSYDPDPAVFLSRLRDAGVSESVRRTLVKAAIDARFRDREEALESASTAGWWQWQETRLSPADRLALLDLHREKLRLYEQLVGPDPDDGPLDTADNPIAPEKRGRLALITEDYRALLANIRSSPTLLPSDREAIAFLEAERTREIEALLSPLELAAYRARTDEDLGMLQSRLRHFDATDEEFAAIQASHREFNEQTGVTRSIRETDEWNEDERIREAIGDARFEAYEQSKGLWFTDLQALIARSGLPKDTIQPIYRLWRSIESESHAIYRNAVLTTEQKKTALVRLGEQTRREVLVHLGPEIGEAYLKSGRGQWMEPAIRGEVVTFSPSGHQSSFPDFTPTTSPRVERKQ